MQHGRDRCGSGVSGRRERSGIQGFRQQVQERAHRYLICVISNQECPFFQHTSIFSWPGAAIPLFDGFGKPTRKVDWQFHQPILSLRRVQRPSSTFSQFVSKSLVSLLSAFSCSDSPLLSRYARVTHSPTVRFINANTHAAQIDKPSFWATPRTPLIRPFRFSSGIHILPQQHQKSSNCNIL